MFFVETLENTGNYEDERLNIYLLTKMTSSENSEYFYFDIFPFCLSIFIGSRMSIGLFLHTLLFYVINSTLATRRYWV